MFKNLRSIAISYLPSQYKEIAENFSYVLALRIAQQIINFISFFFIINYVQKDIVGNYQFVLSVIALVSVTSLPGMRNALMQSVARGHGGFFKVATRYAFLGSLIGSFILILIAGYYYFQNNIFMAIAFSISSLFMPFSKGLFMWKASYSGQERFKQLSLIDASASLISSALLMISVMFYTNSHVILLSITVLIPSLQNLILWKLEANRYKYAPTSEEGMSEYGLKTSAYQIFPLTAREIDKLSVYSFMSSADLAAYNVAMKIPEAIKSVIQNLGDVIMPKFARTNKITTKMHKSMGGISALLFIAITFFAFAVFPIIFDTLVPDEYNDSLHYSQALLCTVAIGNYAILRSKYIKSQKDLESFKKLSFMSSAVKIVLSPLFIFFMGVWGAIAAILIQRVVLIVLTESIVRKLYRENKT